MFGQFMYRLQSALKAPCMYIINKYWDPHLADHLRNKRRIPVIVGSSNTWIYLYVLLFIPFLWCIRCSTRLLTSWSLLIIYNFSSMECRFQYRTTYYDMIAWWLLIHKTTKKNYGRTALYRAIIPNILRGIVANCRCIVRQLAKLIR